MKRISKTPLALLCILSAACAGDLESDTQQPEPPVTGGDETTGDEETTFDHDNSGTDVFELLERIATEGPARYAARMHGCSKLRYDTLGQVLGSLGVDMAATNPTSAARLYQTGYNALGGSNYEARVRENLQVTTSAASRTFDILAAAAPEIIASMPTLALCTRGGAPTSMFDGADQCTEAGVSCLLGVPALSAHIELCNQTVSRASTPELGKDLAVATLLAAAHTCE